MLLGQFKSLLPYENPLKNMAIHAFLALFTSILANVLEDDENPESYICCGARNLNKERMSIILQTIILDDFKFISTSSFQKILTGKERPLFHKQLFRMVIMDHAASKRWPSFSTNVDAKSLSVAFDCRELLMI